MTGAALCDAVARIARHEVAARLGAGVGRVTDLFPGDGTPPDHAVSVEMRDTGLVLPRVPVATGALGLAAIPAVGDLVVVVFCEGDAHAPVVVGRLYHADLRPPDHAEGQLVLRLPPGRAEGDVDLVIDGGEPSVRLKLPGDVLIEIVREKVVVQSGKMRLAVDGAGGGRAEVAAGGSTITLRQDGDVTVVAKGKLRLEGTEVEIAGSARVKVSGAVVELN